MKTTRTKWHACYACGARFDCISDFEGEQEPKPGDYTLCIECAAILVIGKDLAGREPTARELALLAADPAASAKFGRMRRLILQRLLTRRHEAG